MTTETLPTNGDGRPKGRAVPPLPDFTFASGITVRLRPVSQFTHAHIEITARRKFPPPEPPMYTHDYGDGPVQEPNRGDPAYQQAVSDHNMLIRSKMMDATIELGIEVEIDEARLNEVKRVMELIGTPLDEPSEKIAYVKHCCLIDIEREMPRLMAALRARPTDEEVAEQASTFRGDVPGA